MTQPLKLSSGWICAFVASGAIVIGMVVALPLVRQEITSRDERAAEARENLFMRYKARLAPCDVDVYYGTDIRLKLQPNEIAIDVIPLLSSEVYGTRISDRSIRSYTGDQTLFIPPPPPPPGSDPTENQTATPRMIFSSAKKLPSDVGGKLAHLLKAEIDHATAQLDTGKDGVMYVFRYDDKCGAAWSPRPDTRAHQLASLAEKLVLLTRSSPPSKDAIERVEQQLKELEADTLLVDG